jgi:hypothetical protein
MNRKKFLKEKKIRVERKVHHMYKEYNDIIERGVKLPKFYNIMGKYHYFYFKDNKHISLIHINRNFIDRDEWEICSGGTCSNCVDAEEKFPTRKEAEKRIFELLA